MTSPAVDRTTTTGLPDPMAEEMADALDSRTPWRRLLARFIKNRTAMAALIYLVLLVILALLAPYASPHNPAQQHLDVVNHGPSAAHWLGTDSLGRDILSRLIYGARVSMRVAGTVVILAAAIAVPIGLIAGYFGGRIDGVSMRFMDGLFAFPPLMLALAVAALLGPSITNASIAIAIPFVPGFARLVRAEVLSVREEAFIEASRSVGVRSGRMIRRHVVPNVASPFIVQAAVSFGFALLAEAGLSFLGFGVQPPYASWGTMLADAYNYVVAKPWAMVPPGLAIMFTVLAFNLLGDGLRDALGREVFIVKGDK